MSDLSFVTYDQMLDLNIKNFKKRGLKKFIEVYNKTNSTQYEFKMSFFLDLMIGHIKSSMYQEDALGYFYCELENIWDEDLQKLLNFRHINRTKNSSLKRKLLLSESPSCEDTNLPKYCEKDFCRTFIINIWQKYYL